jgi:hypothetical protein
MKRPLSALALLPLLAAPSGAAAFQQTMTCSYDRSSPFACGPGESAVGVHWARRCVQYKVNVRGSKDIPTGANGKISDALLNTIRDSFDAWTRVDCSNFRMEFVGLTEADVASFDKEGGIAGNENILTWLDDWPYDRDAYALTSVTFDSRNGRIQDADIEMNDDIFQFTIGDEQVLVDVQNTLVHEIGHFLGLDHSSDADATMYFSAREGETKKRTLAQDDIDGICTIYPDGSGELSCTKNEGGDSVVEDDAVCMSVGAASALPGLWTLFAAALGLHSARRKRAGHG